MSRVVELFPDIKPYDHGWLMIRDKDERLLHNVYYEQCGNPEGKPILYIPGGPGEGSAEKDRRLFDPEKWRYILIDPRGCGRSRPNGELGLRDNNPQHTIKDIHEILKRLQIEKVALLGWSWGSTLALLYAINHPEEVSGIIAGGICLGEKEELSYLSDGKMATAFPKEWRIFNASDQSYNGNVAKYYYDQITSPPPFRREYFAKQWLSFHMAILGLDPSDFKFDFENMALIQTHYFMNSFFLPDRYIVENAHKIPNMPIFLVHGANDVLSQLKNAERLLSALPPQSYLYKTYGGHSKSDEKNLPKLLESIDLLYKSV